MEQCFSMRWGIVCAVDREDLLSDLTDFGIWLCRGLEEKSAKLGLTHQFDPTPDFVFHVNPHDQDAFLQTYSVISTEHPAVILTLQILPEQESEVYNWMKALPNPYGKIKQGIILENALSRFHGLDLNKTLFNILQWITTRLSLQTSSADGYKHCKLRIGPSNESTLAPGHIVRMTGVENAVQAVIHSGDAGYYWPLPSLKVVGFPASFSQYQVAALFYYFNVAGVHFENDFAIVCFVNKFHAVQAAMMMDNLELDSEHLLQVTPLYNELKIQLEVMKGSLY